MNTDFEEKYENVLQNMELALVKTYRTQPGFIDSGALYVVETLIKVYVEEQRGREAKIPQFEHHEQEAFESLKSMCEWRLGRESLQLNNLKENPDELAKSDGFIKTTEEIINCLKRIKKSIEVWGKRSANRRAYFEFVRKFVV